MEFKDIQKKLGAALKAFEKDDSLYLLQHDVNERSVTHKLAEHLQAEFRAHKVDCEYNKDCERRIGSGVKLIGELKKREKEILQRYGRRVKKGALTVYPDIIVHKRGIKKDNLFVIEVKMTSSTAIRNSKSKAAMERDFDRFKLQEYTRKGDHFLGYQCGAFIEFRIVPKMLRVACEVNWYGYDDMGIPQEWPPMKYPNDWQPKRS